MLGKTSSTLATWQHPKNSYEQVPRQHSACHVSKACANPEVHLAEVKGAAVQRE